MTKPTALMTKANDMATKGRGSGLVDIMGGAEMFKETAFRIVGDPVDEKVLRSRKQSIL